MGRGICSERFGLAAAFCEATRKLSEATTDAHTSSGQGLPAEFALAKTHYEVARGGAQAAYERYSEHVAGHGCEPLHPKRDA